MATLETVFRIYDGYSNPLNRMITGTDKATNKMLKASGVTDTFNTKLNKTGTSAGLAASGIGKLVGSLISMAAAKKSMDITDSFINTKARLDMMNDGLQTTAELQDKVFASAQKSRGSYLGIASAISKMGILAGDAFGSNDEIINFTELMQKSFKLGGSSRQEQTAAMYQLTQAMASGRLQGDEFRSLTETSPMLMQAISAYTGKTKGQLKEMSAEGVITADIIKKSMFNMADDINDRFKKMPRTFGDIWNDISSRVLKRFEPTMDRVSALINTPKFNVFTDAIVGGMGTAADGVVSLVNAFSDLTDAVKESKDELEPFLFILGGTALTAGAQKIWTIAAGLTVANGAILLAGAGVGLVGYAFVKFGEALEILIGVTYATTGNMVRNIADIFILLANSVISVATTVDMIIERSVNAILTGINAVIAGLNKIPGMDIGAAGYFKGFMPENPYLKYTDRDKGYKQDYETGALFSSWITNGLKTGIEGVKDIFGMGAPDEIISFADFSRLDHASTKDPTLGLDQGFGGSGSQKPIEVTGKGGREIKVDISKQDLKYLKDVAEREYINKFSTATLAPNVTVQFTGPISKDVDTDKMYKRIGKIMREQIAIVEEG